MNSRIKLGDFDLDLGRLIETKLLIQANSGGGKSHAIRKILEATHGKVQHIVLDMEGEFATLREKYDYVLAGKGGDVPADPRSAELLAIKLLELGASAIIDLYELKHHQRIQFVKLFLDAMINAPKELWHEVLIVIDEAHVFAPEKGQAESLGSVVDLASRGRKRGYSAILATQRLSKLHKDVAAECGNKLIGRTGLDIDMKRASEELGFSTKADLLSLRNLDPGDFFAFGPALTRSVTKVHIGAVETKHPKAGQRLGTHKPDPTSKVKALLSKLTDLPKEAEEELRDKTSLQNRIRELERKLRTTSNTPTMNDADKKSLYEKAIQAAKKEISKKILKLNYTLSMAIGPVVSQAIADCNGVEVDSIFKFASPTPSSKNVILQNKPIKSTNSDDRKFGKCDLSILQFLASREGRAFSKIQVCARTHYSPKSSGFQNAISSLSTAGFLIRDQGLLQISSTGMDFAISSGFNLQEGGTPLEAWKNSLGKCERAIFEQLLDDQKVWSKDMLANCSGYSVNSSGFQNALSYLCSLGLAKRIGSGIQLNEELIGI